MNRLYLLFVTLLAVMSSSAGIAPTASADEQRSTAPANPAGETAADPIRDMQSQSASAGTPLGAHWGHNPGRYSTWTNHSNRLIPVYTFGLTLDSLREQGSTYRDADRLKEIYGVVPAGTLNPTATYYDQTAIHRLQKTAAEQGHKYIILMVFDGMDWQTTRAAAIHQSGQVAYQRGRGTGLSFQDYRGTETDFGLVVTSPKLSNARTDVDAQTVLSAGSESTGGYDPDRGGRDPWHEQSQRDYLLGTDRQQPHSVTDSAASATSLTSGIKTYNGAINVGVDGTQVLPIARQLQQEKGFAVGLVSSVPVSHATPAASYANNVQRSDYQDITRDLIGLPSAAHRREPLPGVDVLIGGGWGESKQDDKGQGRNFMPGNRYLHEDDLHRVDAAGGGKYVVAQRIAGRSGKEVLMDAAQQATADGDRLLGFFGVPGGHLPFQTADGRYDPAADVKAAEHYSESDVAENPSLAEMTEAALSVLETADEGFWLLVEAGDVDWANHANNIDNSIGAVHSGAAAFDAVTEWVERHDVWDETAVIVTSDHGHFLVLDDEEKIASAGRHDQTKRADRAGKASEVPPGRE